MLPSIERISAAVEPELKRVLDKVTTFIEVITKIPLLDGVLVDVPTVATSPGTRVFHKLGRTPRGVIVIASSAGVVYTESTSWTESTLVLIAATATSKARIWVF